jgi:hypothetical protein
MKNKNPTNPTHESMRANDLNRTIEEVYGHLASDEVEILAITFDNAFSEMFEVLRVGRKNCLFGILGKLDASLSVMVPPEITADLKRYDPFWAVVGRKQGTWHLIYLSPLYSSNAVHRWAKNHGLF